MQGNHERNNGAQLFPLNIIIACVILLAGLNCSHIGAGQVVEPKGSPSRISDLQPVPRIIRSRGEWEQFGSFQVEIVGKADKIRTYAKRRFIQDCATHFSGRTPGGKLMVVMGTLSDMSSLVREADIGGSATRIPSQGYILRRFDDGENPRVLVIGGDPAGVLYGSLTLFDIIDNHGGLPAYIHIEDSPALAIRFMPSVVRHRSEKELERLDSAVKGRLNAFWTGRTYNRLKTRKGELGMKAISAMAAERGMTIYEQFSLHRARKQLGRDWCISRAEDRKFMLDQMDKWIRLGVTGIAILFDDIKPEITCCEACRKKYANIGRMQADITRIAQAFCKSRGVDKFIVCPTLYRAEDIYGAHGDPVEYYKHFGAIRNTAMFHCAYRTANMEKLKVLGMHDWVWWYNGPFPIFGEGGYSRYSRPDGFWEGFADFYWGWYNTYMHPMSGLTVKADTVRELASIAERGARGGYCVPGGSAGETYRNLIFMWDPARFDEKNAFAPMVKYNLGRKNLDAYQQWHTISRRWLPRIMDGAKLRINKKTYLAELKKDVDIARRAVAVVEKNLHSDLGKTPCPLPASSARIALNKMKSTVAHLEKRMEFLAKGSSSVTVARPRQIKWGVGKTAYIRHIRDIRFMDGSHSLYVQYLIAEHPGKIFSAPPMFNGGGLCFLGPSVGNWGDLGFFGLRLGKHELQNNMATEIKKIVHGANGREACLMRWFLPSGKVKVILSLEPDGALTADISWQPNNPSDSCSISLFCNPNAGRTAAKSTQGKLTKWDRRIRTPEQNVRVNQERKLNFKRENWIVYYDKTYNANYDFADKPNCLNICGPCGVLLRRGDFAWGHVAPKGYGVKTYLRANKGIRNVKMKFYDLRSRSTEDLCNYFKKL